MRLVLLITWLITISMVPYLFAADGPAGAATLAASGALPRKTRSSPRQSAVVQMKGEELKFFPPKLTIRAGQTVEWENSSKEVHDIVDNPTDPKLLNRADVQLPAGAQPFDSGYLQPGQVFKHRFTAPGTYHYVCSLHEIQHMLGEIVVLK